MGNKRYYAAPVGMIREEELPDGWGLLEVEKHCVRIRVEPKPKEANKSRECMMLMSALRRLEISTAVFVRQEENEDAPAENQGNGEHVLTTGQAQNAGE
jgi:hypothetical protein